MIDFFRDYDKLRSGLISETQFQSSISLAVEKRAHLNQNDIKKLTEYYRQPDGRIFYKDFVDSMDHAFNIPEFEKKPLTEIIRPGKGILSRVCLLLFNRIFSLVDRIILAIEHKFKSR